MRRPVLLGGAPVRVTDVHIHIQPWRMLKAPVLETFRARLGADWERLQSLADDPAALLEIMDADGVARVGLVTDVSPNVMGLTDEANDFTVRFARAAPERLLPFGGVDPVTSPDAERALERLLDLGIRLLKIHPPHMRCAANAYTEGLDALATLYRRCEAEGLPVMIHTGTSIFPGARSKFGNPMEIDDVAIDFPDLRIVMAHGGRPLYTAEAFFILRRHPNVWLDLSGIPPLRIPEYFPRLDEIAPKVLWGTDWPSPGVASMRPNVEQFLSLPLREDTQRAALETNPERLLP
ncbi:MAG TPA: amidohydrolase family protein [Gemmatimonadaceae bacterium]|nr:amidohydrolase family protein [Gemmatimonadaceae bacterium]